MNVPVFSKNIKLCVIRAIPQPAAQGGGPAPGGEW